MYAAGDTNRAVVLFRQYTGEFITYDLIFVRFPEQRAQGDITADAFSQTDAAHMRSASAKDNNIPI